MGVLRHKHLARTTPRKITLGFLHAHCGRGKQRQLRTGFDLAIPGTFTTGWNWLEPWLQAWQQLPESARAKCGLCFHPDGQAWSLSEVQTVTQSCFAGKVEGASTMTSYSWRRLAPTVGHLVHLDPKHLSALGDWQDRSEQGHDNKMALHYSSAKYGESLRAKAMVLGAMSQLQTYDVWEAIPPQAASDAVEEGRRLANSLLSKDSHVVWSVPLTAQEMARRFAVSQVLREKAARRREEAHGAEAIRAMPNHIMGRQLTTFMRDGTLLCGAFQVGRCTREESACGASHRCAILQKSGRACGGHHPAQACRDIKRAMLVQEPATPAPEPAEQPVREEAEELPPLKRRKTAARTPEAKARPKQKRPVEPPYPPPLPVQGTSSSASAGQAVVVEDVEPMVPDASELRYDRLATTRGKTAQAPTLIHKSSRGGKVYLAGLPTVATLEHFPATDLQIVCFPETPAAKGGTQLPGAMVRHLSPTWVDGRTEQWRQLWPLLRSSVYDGNTIVIHCVAGRHRAAAVAAVVRSLLERESLDASAAWLTKHRDVQLHKITHDRGVGQWMSDTVKSSSLGNPLPPLVGFAATTRSQLHVVTEDEVPLCLHKQGSSAAGGRLVRPMRTADMREAVAWGRQWCSNCMGKAPARLLNQIHDM